MKDIDKLDIILADDDFEDRSFFREVLQDLKPGSTLLEFEDGKQLMDHLGDLDKLPHLIFLDINMPLKTGIQCLKEIRENARFSNVPLIIFTTSSSKFEVDNAYNCGANLYIRKPYLYKEGVEALRKFFSDFDSSSILKVPRENFYVEL
jgi:CheY-like chemotaxis protein